MMTEQELDTRIEKMCNESYQAGAKDFLSTTKAGL